MTLAGAYTMGGHSLAGRLERAIPPHAEHTMTYTGAIVAMVIGTWIFAYHDIGEGRLAGLIIAIAGLITAATPMALKGLSYIFRRFEESARERRLERKLVIGQRINEGRIEELREKSIDQTTVLIVFLERLEKHEKRMLDRQQQILRKLAVDRAWMKQVSPLAKIPLPPGFGENPWDFDNNDGSFSAELAEFRRYLLGEATPKAIVEVRQEVARLDSSHFQPIDEESPSSYEPPAIPKSPRPEA